MSEPLSAEEHARSWKEAGGLAAAQQIVDWYPDSIDLWPENVRLK